MRVVINLALFLVICGLSYVLINSIQEPIAFKAEKDLRESAVISRLKAIRAAQGVYKEVTQEGYASDFDSLVHVIKTGKIMNISAIGDADDPNNPVITYDTSYLVAMDRIEELNEINKGKFKIILDSLKFVPYSNGKTFEIAADTITYQQTLVDVVEVKTKKANYMGKFASPRYARYDASYDPGAYIKFGDLYAPNTTGNWE